MKQNTISIKDVTFFIELTTDEQALLVGGCRVKTKNGTVLEGDKCVVKADGTVIVTFATPVDPLTLGGSIADPSKSFAPLPPSDPKPSPFGL